MHIFPSLPPIAEPADDDDLDDAAVGFAPHCPSCLHTVEPHQVGRGVAWRCPRCELVVIG